VAKEKREEAAKAKALEDVRFMCERGMMGDIGIGNSGVGVPALPIETK
jgi:hypothetical protein